MDLEKLGRRIRTARKSRNLTLEELSSRLEVNPSYLSEIERGNRTPSLKVLCNLSSLLEIPRSFLHDVIADPEGGMKSFGETLEGRRKELNLTKNELAQAIGWPESYIESIESGNNRVPEEFARDFAKALKLPTAFFELSASEAIGQKIKYFRNNDGLTQKEVAAESGLSTSLISKIERGEVVPSLRTLVKLSKAMGVSPCCFVFQLSQDHDFHGGFTKSRQEGTSAKKEVLLEEIITSLFDLDSEGLKKLSEYISELKK